MIIVIPCHNEPDLIGTLESLIQCDPVDYPVEVIIVVNDAEGTRDDVRSMNESTIGSLNHWVERNDQNRLSFHLIEALDLPNKHAGVGLARKIGMDEALRRFVAVNVNGTIVCLDADCRVSKNYLKAIDEQFVQSDAGLGEIYYQHQFEHEKEETLKTGIVNYELFLRYYVHGLKQAGFPYAIQTIGSCMLVKAAIYAKHGGMNKRKAGEDFYFLHKIIPHEEFVEVDGAAVYPSCRTSDRVPFGTGKAQNDWLKQNEKTYLTYDPRIFDELKLLLNCIEEMFIDDLNEVIDRLPQIPKAFMGEFLSKLVLIKSNCKSSDQFRKQFFIWFDGFMCMKFVHFVRDDYYRNVPIQSAVQSFKYPENSRIKCLISALKAFES